MEKVDFDKIKAITNDVHDLMIDKIFDTLNIAHDSIPTGEAVRSIYKYTLMSITHLLAAECISVSDKVSGQEPHVTAKKSLKSCVTDAERMIDLYFVSEKRKRAAN